MVSPLHRTADFASPSTGHVLWVAEAALGRLRKTVPSGGLVDDGDGFVFLKEEVRRHGGAVHALARLETVATPAWRPLDAGYVAMAGQVEGALGR